MPGKGFPKAERLSSEKAITALFQGGQGGFVYPYRYLFTVRGAGEGEIPRATVLISVSKRYHKKAVRRNLLKRRTREAYRHAKEELSVICATKGVCVDIAFIYSSKESEPFKVISNAAGKITREISKVL